ncbi:MAG: hypothetical protein ABSE47_02240 [Acidimicrobiales bacterium]
MHHGAGSRYRRRPSRLVRAGVVLLAVFGAACSGGTGAGPGSSSQPHPTTTVLPASFEVGFHTFYWDDTAPGVTHVGPGDTQVPGRILTTEVRYPTLAGAAGQETRDAQPAKAGSPFPVIMFAHGYDTEPSDYRPLLDAWVRAGFVVVAPIFPDENAKAVAAAGGPDEGAEEDEFNEPGDLVYVFKQLASIGGQPWGANLSGVMDLSDIALAGQSDGADVVAALSYTSMFRALYGGLPSAPRAVVVMSGSQWGQTLSGPVGLYRARASSPALLQIQSDADGCVLPAAGVAFWRALEPGLASKWFVTLFGADHLGPFEGTAPWAAVVESVTTKFFELELHWRSSSVSAAAVTSAGTVTSVSVAGTRRAVDMPASPSEGGCFAP